MRLLARECNRPADVLLAQLTDVLATDRDATSLGVEEAQEEVRHRGLARAARAEEGDASSRLERQVEALEHGGISRGVARRHAFERDARGERV